jgi:hypothetical protein
VGAGEVEGEAEGEGAGVAPAAPDHAPVASSSSQLPEQARLDRALASPLTHVPLESAQALDEGGGAGAAWGDPVREGAEAGAGATVPTSAIAAAIARTAQAAEAAALAASPQRAPSASSPAAPAGPHARPAMPLSPRARADLELLRESADWGLGAAQAQEGAGAGASVGSPALDPRTALAIRTRVDRLLLGNALWAAAPPAAPPPAAAAASAPAPAPLPLEAAVAPAPAPAPSSSSSSSSSSALAARHRAALLSFYLAHAPAKATPEHVAAAWAAYGFTV